MGLICWMEPSGRALTWWPQESAGLASGVKKPGSSVAICTRLLVPVHLLLYLFNLVDPALVAQGMYLVLRELGPLCELCWMTLGNWANCSESGSSTTKEGSVMPAVVNCYMGGPHEPRDIHTFCSPLLGMAV
jgi:hypothetical protein